MYVYHFAVNKKTSRPGISFPDEFLVMVWRRHMTFLIGMAVAILAIPLPAPLLKGQEALESGKVSPCLQLLFVKITQV